MTRVYTFINLHPTERNRYLHAFESELSKVLLEGLELWAASRNDGHSRTPRHRLLEFRDGLSTEWEQILADALIVAVNFSQLTGTEQLASAWTKLKLIVEGLPHSDEPLRALNCDARNLPVADDLIDLVITSPPYINVFNYHQQYRASAEALGWDLLTIARSEIGSNRKHRANRFLTVVQYCLDITQVLSELSRVCRPSARVTFVVGRESMVRGVRFFNGEIVGMLASKCTSLRLHFRQERSFRNRFGELIVEDILHFNLMKSRKHSDLFNSVDARRVAQDMLKRSLAGINDSAIEADVRDAIVKIEEVQPSPIFSLDRAKHKPPNN